MNEQKFKQLIAYKYNNKYNLEKIWFRNTEYPINVICNIHGEFIIKHSIFLNSRGCLKCKEKPLKTKESKPLYTFKDYTKDLEKDYSFVYCVKLINKETKESFIKIGVTRINIFRRLSPKYFEITPIIMYQTSNDTAYVIEKEIHKLFRPYSYKPKFIPSGSTECYRIEDNVPKKLYHILYT